MTEKTTTSSTLDQLKKAQQHGNLKVGLGFKGSKVRQPKKLEKKKLVGEKKKEEAPVSRPAPPP